MPKGEDKIIMTNNLIKNKIIKLLEEAGVSTAELVLPPKPEMGDLALPCFALAKETMPDGRQVKKNPAEAAIEIKNKLLAFNATPGLADKTHTEVSLVEKIETAGPYVNFYLNKKVLAEDVLSDIKKSGAKYGRNNLGAKKKIVIEYAQPNTHKAFHIGHLRGTITGESLARILENAGYKVTRVNYQGDVGMHIAKCLWGIMQLQDKYMEAKKKNIAEKVKFLGEAYAYGATVFEEKPSIKDEIVAINDKIYSSDKDIKKVYTETRKWSLEYFDGIYKKLDTHFDKLYFESETFERGVEIVKEFLAKGIFKESEGAIIFAGSEHGLHDRVFINSKGFPTYEAKDLALAEKQFSEYKPDEIIHIVAKEQTEYFKVMFKALEQVLPQSKDKEKHLAFGWVSLKEGKMSSRTGKVVLGEWLLDETTGKILTMMNESDFTEKEKNKISQSVALGAVKYSFLKTGIKNDIIFDFEETISLSGDSGAYLLYTIARINGIVAKAGKVQSKKKINVSDVKEVFPAEKDVLIKLAEFPEATFAAAEQTDPSKIAKYLLDLSQAFNNFYHNHDILKAEKAEKDFRLELISAVQETMVKGLNLLGIKAVERM